MSLTIRGRPIHFSLKWLKPPPAPPDGTMTLFEHLRELRYRLVVASLAIIVGMVIAWFFRDPLLEILQRPYFEAIEDLKAKNPDADHIPGQHQSDVAAHLGLESLSARRRPFSPHRSGCTSSGRSSSLACWPRRRSGR